MGLLFETYNTTSSAIDRGQLENIRFKFSSHDRVVFFAGLFSECTSLCSTICYGKQMSSCSASVNFDQMLRVSRNPIRTPACHVFSAYKHWQIPRKQAKHVTLEPAHLSSGLDVIAAKRRQTTMISHPSVSLLWPWIVPTPLLAVKAYIKLTSWRGEAFYGCPALCYTSSPHVRVRMTFTPPYRWQEMLLILLVSAQVFCRRYWAGSWKQHSMDDQYREHGDITQL